MFHSPARSKRLVALLLLLVAALAAGFALRSPIVVSALQPDPVTAAWEKARASGSYHFDTDVVQITLPSSKITNVGRSSRTEELRLEGQTNLLEKSLELQLWAQGGSVAQAGSATAVKVVNGKTYLRQGGNEWKESNDVSLEGLAPEGDFMGYLRAVRDVVAHEPEMRGGVTFTRYSFSIDSLAFALHIHDQMEAALRAKGELPPTANLEIPRQYRDMVGEGELWIDSDGLPLRQILTLQFPEQNDQTVNAQIKVSFSKFGEEAKLLQSADFGLRTMLSSYFATRNSQFAILFTLLPMLGFVLIVLRYHQARKLQNALALAVIVSFVLGPILSTITQVRFLDAQSVKAATQKEQEQEADAQQSLQEAMDGVPFNPHEDPVAAADRRIQAEAQQSAGQAAGMAFPAAVSAAIIPVDNGVDTDFDKLSDFVEQRVGTDPTYGDSDEDKITDGIEVKGFVLGGKTWYANALEADSNGDGIADTVERDVNGDGTPDDTDGDGTPDLFDFDNDNDGVADNKDSAPFSATASATPFSETNPLKLTVKNLTSGKPTFVDFQIRPKDPKHLWFAFNVLDWPQDAEGQVRDIDGKTYADLGSVSSANEANGDMKLVPMLELRIPNTGSNLPPASDLTPYNITVNNYSADGNTKSVYIPLSLVTNEKTGERVAFSGRMRYLPTGSWPTAHEVRLAWVVQALVDMPCDHTDPQDVAQGCAEDDYVHNVGQVIQTYYDDWSLTGLNVNEDNGASMAIVYEDPAVDANKKDDAALTALSHGLDNAFLAARDKDGNGVRDLDINELVRRFNRTSNSGVSETLRWAIPNTLRVEKVDYTTSDQAVVFTAMTETKRILNAQFTSPWQSDPTLKPLLLYAQEQRSRSVGLDGVKNADGFVTQSGSDIVFDLAPAGQVKTSLDVMTSVKWTPYCAPSGGAPSWAPCDVDTYWTDLEQRYGATPLAGDPANDADLAAGRIVALQLYAITLMGGISRVVQRDNQLVSSVYTLKTDGELETLSRIGLSVTGTAVKALANQIITARYVNQITVLKHLGNQFKQFRAGSVGKLGKDSIDILKAFRSGGHLNRLVGTGIVAAVGVVIGGLITGAYFLAQAFLSSDPTANLAAKITIKVLVIGLTTALSIISPIYTAVEWAGAVKAAGAGTSVLKSGSAIVSGAQKAGAIGTVIAIAVTWGFFIYSMVANKVSAFSPEFNKALAETIATTIYYVLLFALSVTVIGTIIAGIIAIIDAILTAICELGVEELRTVPGLGGACFTLGNAAIKVLAYLIYNYDVMIESERNDLVVTGAPKVALANPNKGFTQDNGISISMPVTTTAVHKSPDAANGLMINLYLYFFSTNNLRSTTFKYSLSTAEQALTVERDQMYWDWQNVDVHHYYVATPMYGGQAAANPPPQVTGITRPAGLNRAVDFYFNTGYAMPAYECWAIPHPLIIFGVPPVPLCYKRTLAGSNSTKIDAMKFDIFPATLDGFMTAAAKTDGGIGLSWDAAFPSLFDGDGDGLISNRRYGIDPNDSTWDADGDGLADSYELERRQAGIKFTATLRDTDNDGLTDLQESQIGSNPAKADSDNDGMKDGEEVWHQRYDPATGAATGTWEGGWDVTINATTPFVVKVSSDPLLADGDRDGIEDLAERQLALDPLPANRLDLDNRPYSPVIVNSPPLVVTGIVNDDDRFLAPNQSLIYTSTVVALRKMNPGTLTLNVPAALGVPNPTSPYALAFNPLTFNTAQTLTVQTNLKVIANPASQVANIGSRVQATLNPSNGNLTATGNYTVTVDNDKPAVQITSLKNGDYVRASSQTFYVIGGIATDPTSRPALVRVTASDGFGTRDADGTESWSATVGFREGANTITMFARDAVGNEYTTPTNVTIYGDGAAPGGNISSMDGNYTATRRSTGEWVVKINGTISDPTTKFPNILIPASGVDPESLRVQLEPSANNPGQSLTAGTWQKPTYNASAGTWSIDYVLPSDVTDLPPSAFYNATLYASDKVGNANYGAGLRLRLDVRAPLATLTKTDISRNLLSSNISSTVSIGGLVADPMIGEVLDELNFRNQYGYQEKLDVSFAPITNVLPYSGTALNLTFEEPAGAVFFADGSGQGNRTGLACVPNINCPQVGVAGRVGKAIEFAPSSAGLLVKDNVSLNFPANSTVSKGFSVQAWFKSGPNTNSNRFIIAQKGNIGSGPAYILEVNGASSNSFGTVGWTVRGTNGGTGIGTTNQLNVRDQQWHHIVGVYDAVAGKTHIYVDGVLRVSSFTGAIPNMNVTNTSDLLIGGPQQFATTPNSLDQVTIIGHALTQAEVQALYRSVDKVWVPATVVPGQFIGDSATWNLAVPNNLEGMYQIDTRASDYFINTGQSSNLWRGIIDVVSPRVTISGTATGQSVLDGNNVRQYEVKYSCVARDWQLDESKFNCPGNAIQPASRSFNSDPILQSQFPTLTILSTMSNTWTVWQASNVPNGMLSACDATGKCSTSVLGSGAVAAASAECGVQNAECAATGEAFSVAAAEVAAVPSDTPIAHILNPTDGSYVGSVGVVEVTVAAEAAKMLREVSVLLDGEVVATIPFARIDKLTVAQQSVSLPMSAGEHTLEARASDWSGNLQAAGSPVRFTLVSKDPTVALATTKLTISDTYQAQSGIVILQGTVDDTTDNLATVQVKVGDQPYADALVKDGVWGIAYPVIDPENRNLAISVRAIDKAGQITKIGEETSTDFGSDNLPETVLVQTPDANSVTTSAVFSFTGMSDEEVLAAFECQLDQGAFIACTSPANYADLSNGEHSFRVHAINGQGSQDPTPAEFTWTVTGSGVLVKIETAPAALANTRKATFKFKAGGLGDSELLECALDGSGYNPCSSPASYSDLSDGNHNFQVRVKGNPASKHTWHISNATPVAASMVMTTAQNTNLPVTLQANDEDGLTYQIVNKPANGVLQGTAPNLVYQPATDFFGTDSFSFKADDGDASSNLAMVVIHITPTPGQAGVERGNFVVFGQEGVILRENVKVVSGDIAASLSSQGPWLGEGAEVVIGNGVTLLDSKSKVLGDTLFVGQGTTLGDANFNELRGPGTVNGTKVTPQALPLLNRFISLPAIVRGKANVDVASAGSATVNAGSYLDLNVGDGATVVFSGGVYHFQNWNVGKNSKLHFAAASEVRVAGRVLVNERGYVGPAPSSTVTASQIVIYIAGTNANIGNLGGLGIKSATFGPFATLAANVVAPNGTLLIRERSKAVGSFVARWVSVGKFSELSLDNRFVKTGENANASLTTVALHETLLAGAEAGIQSQAQLSADVDAELTIQEGSNEVDPVIAPPDTVTPPDTTTPDAGLNNRVYLPVISSGTVGQSGSETLSGLQSPVSEEASKLVFLPVVVK